MMLTGSLDPCELAIAVAVAGHRMMRKLDRRFGSGHGEKGYGYARDVPGALAELAVAKHFGFYWAGDVNDFGARGDFKGLEVRGSFHEDAHLIVYPGDPDERLVVLVTVRYPQYRIVGCIRAADAKCDAFKPPAGKLRAGSPTQWWVPRSILQANAGFLSELSRR